MTPITDEELHRRVARAELMKRAFIMFTAVMVTLSFAVIIVLLIQGAHRGKENRETLDTIRSCTQPSGECYKRGQEQTAQAVASINRVVILAAACASQHYGQSVTEIQNCVIQRLAQHKR